MTKPAAGQAPTDPGAQTPPNNDGAKPNEGAKPEGNAPGDGQASADGAKPNEGEKPGGEQQSGKGEAPAAADYKFTIPDGAGDLVDDADLEHFREAAAAAGLSQEDAQAELEAGIQRARERHARRVEAWKAKTTADPDLGGDKLTETEKMTKLGIDAIHPVGHPNREAFLALLNEEGYGNHPVVVRFLRDVGMKTAEDSGAAGAAAGAEKSVADTLYDHPTSRTAGQN